MNLPYHPSLSWKTLPFVPISWGYGWAGSMRRMAYNVGLLKRVCPSVPVISVGNLSAGGTGKTPVVMALASWLAAQHRRVVILSRGYGAVVPLEYGQATHPDHGDEPYLMQHHVPNATVIVGRNRAKNAVRAMADYQPEIILLDDGFQYLGLHRTHNILLVDAAQGFGNKHLLPVGPLREPMQQANRATEIWITRSNHVSVEQCALLESQLGKITKQRIPIHAVPFLLEGLQQPLCYRSRESGLLPFVPSEQFPKLFEGKEVVVFSGLAQPKQFETSVQALLGAFAKNITCLQFPDHHPYDERDIQRIFHTASPEASQQSKSTVFITTQKDVVKLEQAVWPYEYASQLFTVSITPKLPPPFLTILSESILEK
jgi:tetraacyldisaccharide 4'-kinase